METNFKRLEYVWLRMIGAFGHTWTSQHGLAPSGGAAEMWGMALSDLSRQDIDVGFIGALASASDFPPSASKFRAYCLNIPPIALIEREILGDDVSEFTKLVQANIHMGDYGQAHVKTARLMLISAYEAAREFVMRGGQVPGSLRIGRDA